MTDSQSDTSLYRSRRSKLRWTFSHWLVIGFDAVPSEAVCAISYFDAIRQVLPGNICLAFLWKLRLILEDPLKNYFCMFWGFIKNCWCNIYLPDEVNTYLIILSSFAKPQILQARDRCQQLYIFAVFWGFSTLRWLWNRKEWALGWERGISGMHPCSTTYFLCLLSKCLLISQLSFPKLLKI